MYKLVLFVVASPWMYPRIPWVLASLLLLVACAAQPDRMVSEPERSHELGRKPQQTVNFVLDSPWDEDSREYVAAFLDKPATCKLTLWKSSFNPALGRVQPEAISDAAWRGTQHYIIDLTQLSDDVTIASPATTPGVRLTCKQSALCISTCERMRTGTNARDDEIACITEGDAQYTPTNHEVSFHTLDLSHAGALRLLFTAEIRRCAGHSTVVPAPVVDSRRQQCARERQALLETEAMARARCASPHVEESRKGCLELLPSLLAYLPRGKCLHEESLGRALEISAFMCRHGLRTAEAEDLESMRVPGCHYTTEVVQNMRGASGRKLAAIARCGLIYLGERGCGLAMRDAFGIKNTPVSCGTVITKFAGSSQSTFVPRLDATSDPSLESAASAIELRRFRACLSDE